MIYKMRSDSKILDDIKSSGKNYLGLYMEDILLHTHELEDKILKNKLIERHYEEQKGFSDKSSSGTRTRVNSLIRIIQANKVIYALELINESDSRITDVAIKKAKDTIKRINFGEIKLPTLG